ncbi:CBS domain-containing protein [Marininema halotolerans]|uniref:CBS domain-containing protein n=1 Tax=Marininema halotolerans TaxID=1155944 RepID=A0A1I6NQI7_9BACL|nr:CBS domain-containing protein [Marininema halotolerans]
MDVDDDLIFLIYTGAWIFITFLHGLLLTIETLIDKHMRNAGMDSSLPEKKSHESLRRITRSGFTITAVAWIGGSLYIINRLGFSLTKPFSLPMTLCLLLSLLLSSQWWWEKTINQTPPHRLSGYVEQWVTSFLSFFGVQLHRDRSEDSNKGVEPALTEKVMQFQHRLIREVMIPRVDMNCLYMDNDLAHNLAVIRRNRQLHYLLCDRDKDQVLGVIHIQDVFDALLSQASPPDLMIMAQPEVVIPETMDIIHTLRTLEEKQAQIAVVVDEFGGTSGMVTLEDITREMFSDLQDKFELSSLLFSEMKGDVFIHPRALITEVNEFFHIAINDPDNDTIGGWLFSQLEKIPQKGDTISYAGWEFIVDKAHDRWIDRLVARPSPKEPLRSNFTPSKSSTQSLSAEPYIDTSLS